MAINLSIINVLHEMERLGVEIHWAGEKEVKILCPFHEDRSPSCSINVDKRLFRCFAGDCPGHKGGDILTLVAGILKSSRAEVFAEMSTRYDFEAAVTINTKTIERYHTAIWEAKPLLKELRKRGVTDAIIREHRLGEFKGRIIIPIRNSAGSCVNLRRYLPGAPGLKKMLNSRGCGKNRLFPVEQLKFDKLVLCGGEIKALVAASLLNQHGIGCLTNTGGEGSWETAFTEHFADKDVWICYDVDIEGGLAADKVAAQIAGTARSLSVVSLPLDPDAYPKGDINDWVGLEGATDADFLALLKASPPWVFKPVEEEVIEEVAGEIHLADAIDAANVSKRLNIAAMVSAMDTSPYIVPRKIRVVCDRSQPACHKCPVFAQPIGNCELSIQGDNPAVLAMVGAPKAVQPEAIREGLGIPECKVVRFTVIDYHNVDDVQLSPMLDIKSRAADDILQRALCVGRDLELNEGFIFKGRMLPRPATQQCIILSAAYTPTQDALSSYTPTAPELEQLKVFRPKAWTEKALTEKLDALYNDLSANVTHIYQRSDLHLFTDLTYHSPLLLDFDGTITRGWVETLLLGDSSQGKTEATQRLQKHYRLGVTHSMKTASVAGVLGGLQQIGTRWWVSWGVMPRNDRRLVILEELKGAAPGLIAALTDMRSSGVAQITKIQQRTTHARTRMIAVSNPAGDASMASYSYGIEAIHDLIEGLEDIRRFDAILLLSKDEIDAAKLNELMQHRPKVKHIHTSELCHRVLLWAWTRTPEQVLFDEEARRAVMEESTRLCSIFVETVPIVDRGGMRFKLARLAASLAMRTFSTGKSMQIARVRECHVRYISTMLERVYSSPTFGYRSFSEAVKASESLKNPKAIRALIATTPHASDFVEQLLFTNRIELRDLCDWCAYDRNDGLELLSTFVRSHALRRDGRSYVKSAAFNALLRTMRGAVQDVPAYLDTQTEM